MRHSKQLEIVNWGWKRVLVCASLVFNLQFSIFNCVQAQTSATLTPDTILLGDQTTLTVSAAAEYPSTDMLSRGGIVALGQRFDTASRTQTTTLTCFEPGDRYVHVGPDDSLLLVVLDVEVDTSATAAIRDIAPIEQVPYTFWEIFRWVLLGLCIVAIAVLAWWLATHRKKIQEVLGTAEPTDTRTPEERALDSLEHLRQQKLWQAGKPKEYHTELTDTVRRFIEEATGIRATDMTSDETVEALSSELGVRSSELPGHGPDSSAPGTPLSELKEIFATADLVKFAKSEPMPHEHDRSMAQAVDFVKQLWQRVKPADEASGKEAPDA